MKDFFESRRFERRDEDRRVDSFPTYLTVPEVADLLRISKSAAYGLCHRHDFPCVRLGRRMIVSKMSLLSYLEAREGEDLYD